MRATQARRLTDAAVKSNPYVTGKVARILEEIASVAARGGCFVLIKERSSEVFQFVSNPKDMHEVRRRLEAQGYRTGRQDAETIRVWW